MCKALHLAAERELSLVAWNQERPGFNVDVANHGLAEVKRHFTLPHIVYAGSHAGCGCGFCWLAPDGYRVEALDAEDIASTKGLLVYLAEALKTNDAIEAYGCWEGDWSEPHQGELIIFVTEALKQDGFGLPEMVRIKFVK